MFNRSEIMKDAHTSARHMMTSPGWAKHGYAYCFQYALGGAWHRAKLAALTATEKRISQIKSEIASLDYKPLAQRILPRRAELQTELPKLAA